jgi:hypothetical protein
MYKWACIGRHARVGEVRTSRRTRVGGHVWVDVQKWRACTGRKAAHTGNGVCTCEGEGCGEELGMI